MVKAVPDEVTSLLRAQANVISREQLCGLDMSRRTLDWLLENETWTRLDTALFYAGAGDPPWRSLAWAASLAAGSAAIVTGPSAAQLHGLTTTDPRPITLVVPRGAPARNRYFSKVTRSDVPRNTVTCSGLLCTSTADTLIDCAASLTARELDALVTTAFQRRRVTPGALRKAIARRRFVPQRATLQTAADDAALGAHSVIELDYLRDVERAHGLPEGTRQSSVQPGEYTDVWYERYGVIVELDGRKFHENSAFRDRRRDNRNAMSAATTLRFGQGDLGVDPCAIARDVAEALIVRGWTGLPTHCDRCR